MLSLKKWLTRYPELSAIGNTPLIRVKIFEDECPNVAIFAKCEYANPGGSLKDRPVRHMLLQALEDGTLHPGKTILDSTSGNAGISYAALGALFKFPVELVAPGNISLERKKRIQVHGASLIETDPVQGYDEALREAHRRFKENPQKYFMSDQYTNDNNWKAHFQTTADEILQQIPEKITHFVVGVGTGGTLTGCGRRFKEFEKKIQVVLADIEEFPGIEGLKPLSPGSILPKNFEPSLVDRRISVSLEDAAAMCRKLASQGFFVGQSSGAYLYVAHQIAKEIKRGCIVTLFNDIGERYFSTRLWD